MIHWQRPHRSKGSELNPTTLLAAALVLIVTWVWCLKVLEAQAPWLLLAVPTPALLSLVQVAHDLEWVRLDVGIKGFWYSTHPQGIVYFGCNCA